MAIEVGQILEGKVTGISKFGAFVRFEDGKSGMVHISEISDSYVTEIKDFLSEGQTVKVKVISIDDKGRINLSIKKADTNRETSRKPAPSSRPFSGYSDRKQSQPMSFEEMMSKFKQDSEAKFADLKTTREGRRSNYARRSQK